MARVSCVRAWIHMLLCVYKYIYIYIHTPPMVRPKTNDIFVSALKSHRYVMLCIECNWQRNGMCRGGVRNCGLWKPTLLPDAILSQTILSCLVPRWTTCSAHAGRALVRETLKPWEICGMGTSRGCVPYNIYLDWDSNICGIGMYRFSLKRKQLLALHPSTRPKGFCISDIRYPFLCRFLIHCAGF